MGGDVISGFPNYTRSPAIARRLYNVQCQLKSCPLLHNCMKNCQLLNV